VLSGQRSEYIVTSTPTGFRIVDTILDRDGVDILTGVESVQFANRPLKNGPLDASERI
jgi:hypothetical protein